VSPGELEDVARTQPENHPRVTTQRGSASGA
jgi:hypothetical protein